MGREGEESIKVGGRRDGRGSLRVIIGDEESKDYQLILKGIRGYIEGYIVGRGY